MAMYIVQATAWTVVILQLSLPTQSDVPTDSNVCDGVLDLCCILPENAELIGTVLSPNDKKCVRQNENGESIDGVCSPYYQCNERTLITDGKGIMDIKSIGSKYTNQNERFDTKCVPKSDTPSLNQSSQHSACGLRNFEDNELGMNDTSENQSAFGEFPWTAAVLKKGLIDKNEVFFYQCVASLIHPSVVLTAASCVNRSDSNSLKIRLGEWNSLTK